MSAVHTKSDHRGTRMLAWCTRHWVALALALVALVYAGAVTIIHDDSVSPIDEVVYLDYTYKVWDQGLVRDGELFGDDVAQVVACENVIPFGNFGQECGAEAADLDAMPNAGYTTGAGYTPAYFWTVRLIGDPIHVLTGLTDVTSWRLSGAVWLACTVIALVALFRRWGVPDSSIFATGVLFIASPYAWWTYTYISTDTSVVLFGAVTLLVATEVIRRRWSPWWLVVLGVIGPILKITTLLVFGLVLLYLLFQTIAETRSRRRVALGDAPSFEGKRSLGKIWIFAGSAAVIAVALQYAWMRLVPLLQASDVSVDQGVQSTLSASELLRLMILGPGGAIGHNPAAGIFPSTVFGDIAAPLGWIMVAGVIGAAMISRGDTERAPITWAVATAGVAALPALGIAVAVTGGYFDLPGRYGAALIPAYLLMVGTMLRSRIAIVLVGGYAVALMVFGIWLAAYVGATY